MTAIDRQANVKKTPGSRGYKMPELSARESLRVKRERERENGTIENLREGETAAELKRDESREKNSGSK